MFKIVMVLKIEKVYINLSMTFFNDTFRQFCENFITKEQLKNHLFSNTHLHREVNGYWPAYFPQRSLVKTGNNIFEKAFWTMFIATRYMKKVIVFWSTYFLMTTNMTDYIVEDNEEIG